MFRWIWRDLEGTFLGIFSGFFQIILELVINLSFTNLTCLAKKIYQNWRSPKFVSEDLERFGRNFFGNFFGFFSDNFGTCDQFVINQFDLFSKKKYQNWRSPKFVSEDLKRFGRHFLKDFFWIFSVFFQILLAPILPI